jgi:hypothetical protein
MIRSIGGRVFKATASIPAHLAYQCINLKPVADRLERRRRERSAKHPQDELQVAAEAAVVRGLQNDGVVVTDLAALGLADIGEEPIMACGGRAAAALADRVATMEARRRTGTVRAEPGDLMRYPAIYRWGLNAVLLRITQAYLGSAVGFDGPQLTLSLIDEREVGLRTWHLDREDRRMLKVALYLNDVDEGGGPFQLLSRPDLGASRIGRYRAFDTAALERTLGRPLAWEDVVTCTGKAGTLVFADTGRFLHRGKPATTHARSAIFYSYFPRKPRHPFYTGRSRLDRAQISRLVDGLGPEQRACALWRDGLPGIARLVPTSLQ